MQGLDPRIPFGIQAIMAMVEKELVAHNKSKHPSKYCYFILSSPDSGKFVTTFKCQIFRFASLSYFLQWKQNGGQVTG